MDYQKYNGLVNAMDITRLNHTDFSQYRSENPSNVVNRSNAETSVSSLFFSSKNIDILQQGIINKVYNYSNGNIKIGKQNETELKIIMRSIYFQFGKNNPNNVVEQVKDLNTKVINWSAPEIIANIELHQKFKKDISSLPIPLERSQLLTNKGTKILELKSFV